MKNGFRDILGIQSVYCSDLDEFFLMSTCLFLNFIKCAEGGSVYAWGRGIFGRLGIGVAQDELFPTYVEIGTDGDNDSQGSSSYYTDSPLAIRDHDHRRSGLFCDRDGVFQQNKIVQVALLNLPGFEVPAAMRTVTG
jgi:hypothetical protein